MRTPRTGGRWAGRLRRLGLCGATCFALPWTAIAQTPPATETLEPLVISATRTQMSVFDAPASISVVDGDSVRGGRLGVNISESVGGIAGLVARDRQNYAQDEQVEIRGFGARASFGLRGLRVYVDGIPSTLPDGQGWVSNIDLDSADRIEILRGPYSALYGNSSGGVIQVFTQPGSGAPTFAPSFAAGSNGQVRESTKLTGSNGAVGYDLDLTHFQTDGYRYHSAANRNFANARFDADPDELSHLTVVLNSVASPTAQDPMGLTRAEYASNPRMVDPAAIEYNTRKTFDQTQAGVVYDRKLDADDTIEMRIYGGDRNATQYQAISRAAQASPTSPGGVIVLGRAYDGMDAHGTRHWDPGAGPLTLTAGISYDALDEARTGYTNYVGTTLGVAGQLRRNQANTVRDFDQYLQALWQFAPAWTATAGVRHSRVQFGSDDMPTATVHTGASSSAPFAATLPVIGLEFAPVPTARLYANIGRGFETPTLNELAYRPSGLPGLNFDLHSDSSVDFELGVKTRLASLGQLDAAVFLIDTHNEIVTQTNSGGHAVYQNAGDTQRNGFELHWQDTLGRDGRAQLAYTFLNASYRDPYWTCLTTPCPAPNKLVMAGNQIPAIARSTVYAEIAHRPPVGWQAGIEARAASRMYADDINSTAAPGYAIASVRGGYRVAQGAWSLTAFARVDNLLARKYIGSVIVDETSERFFEPAPGRTALAGASASVTF